MIDGVHRILQSIKEELDRPIVDVDVRFVGLNEWLITANLETDHSMLTKSCSHQWKSYVGFSETYEYCSVCDEKRK